MGEVALPAGAVREPFVDADDIADVALAALTEERHAGQLYELTGPRLLTFAEAVAEIARAARREVQYRQTSVEEYASLLARYGVPDEVISLVTYLFREVLDGRNASLADGVQRARGAARTRSRLRRGGPRLPRVSKPGRAGDGQPRLPPAPAPLEWPLAGRRGRSGVGGGAVDGMNVIGIRRGSAD
jgi:hypothetical protein